MINSVCLLGEVKHAIDGKTRALRIERNIPLNNEFKDDFIPIRYWSNDPNNCLTHIKDGTLIAIRGRIVSDEELGVVIIVEQYRTLRSHEL